MDTKFKPGEYKTRNGQTAHVIYVEDDKAFAFPIIGRIDGNPYFTTWTRNGAKLCDPCMDKFDAETAEESTLGYFNRYIAGDR